MNIPISDSTKGQGSGKVSIKIGLAVIILLTISFICSFLVVAVVAAVALSTPSAPTGIALAAGVAIAVVGLIDICVLVGGLLANLAGIGIGVAGLFVRERPKGASILGLVLNTSVLVVQLGVVFLLLYSFFNPGAMHADNPAPGWNDWAVAWSPGGTQIAFV